MKVPGQVDNPSALATSEVDFASDGTAMRAYLARPSHRKPRGAIIVITEAFELWPQIIAFLNTHVAKPA